MIAGIHKPTSGRIEFDGHDWSRNDLKEIGALIENPPLYDNLTAYENLKVRTLALGLSDALDHMRLALKQSLYKQWYEDKMRQDQLSALAHDLKTPLTIIRGNTELLFDTSLSAEQRECAEYIENSSLQMQDYVQALIEAAKSWDSFQPCMKKVNLDSLLLELKNQIDGLCAVNNITLHWDCGQYPAYITAAYKDAG